MGNIKQVIFKDRVPEPLFNDRFVVELCENVHIHYRNLRLEFGAQEFLGILEALKEIDPETVRDHDYGDNFKNLVEIKLPRGTEFNKRLQIEEQDEGHFHVHYRNLRIELDSLFDMGYNHFQVPLQIDEEFFKKELGEIKGANIMEFRLDDLVVGVFDEDLVDHKTKSICVVPTPIPESPVYAYLNGKVAEYVQYTHLVSKLRPGRSEYTTERYDELCDSIKRMGYRGVHIVILNGVPMVADGHHRVSILYHLYGGEKKIKVLNLTTELT